MIQADEAESDDTGEGTLPRRAADRMAAFYINFNSCNQAVIVPVFGDRHDRMPQKQTQTLLSDRQIVPIAAWEIILGGCNIHCITQQQPR